MSLEDSLRKNGVDEEGTDELRARLHDRDLQLENSVALGNRLYEERNELASQLESHAQREAQIVAVHRREVNSLHQQLSEALNVREDLTQRLHDLQNELREAQEAASRYRDDLQRVSTTNNALRADAQYHEQSQADMRRKSVMYDRENDDENVALRTRIAELQRDVQAARAVADDLRAQRDGEQRLAAEQAADLRDKLQAAQGELDKTKRDAAAERARLQMEVRDARHAAGTAGKSGGANRGSVGPQAAPPVPRLRLEDASQSESRLDRDYEAFSARARGLSTVVFTVEPTSGRSSAAHTSAGLQPAPAPERRRLSRRHLGDSDDDESVALQPVHSPNQQRDSGEIPTESTRLNGTCPTCGRGDSPPAKQDKGCPCVVM